LPVVSYGRETPSVTLRQACRLRVRWELVLRRYFGLMRTQG